MLCEHGSAILDGDSAAALIEMAGPGLTPGARSDAIIRGLESAGLVDRHAGSCVPREAGYWESAGVRADPAAEAARRGIRLHAVGAVDQDWAEEALGATGIRVTAGPDAGLDVVLTDDLVHPAVAEIAQDLRKHPWLLAKPVGIRLVVAPVFEPEGPCHGCLSFRVRGHRVAEQYLAARRNGSWPTPPVVDLAATRALGIGLAATAAMNWLGGVRPARSSLMVLDAVAMVASQHVLTKRPQCPDCGDPGIVARSMGGPVRPTSRSASPHRDGGRRADSPEQMLARFGHLVDSVTGVVAALVPVATDLPFTNIYTSGPNRAMPVRSLNDLRHGLRSHSCGKGATDAQARASALGEALERASGVFQGDEPRVRTTYDELGESAIHPNAVQLFSERQLARPLDGVETLDWTPVWSLTRGAHRYLPTSLLFYGHRDGDPPHLAADSNGNAAGTSLEDAMLQACYEVIERDAVGIWWYNRLRCPAVDLDHGADPWIERQQDGHGSLGRKLWALDVTSDLGIPTVAAMSKRGDNGAEDIIFGFGAHPDGRVAARRAVSELNQMLPAVAHVRADGTGYAAGNTEQLRWWRTARVAEHPYLGPDPDRPATRFPALAPDADSTLGEEWGHVQSRLEERGLEVLAIDMTRPDVGLPTVKVVVPGLRHFWPRFAPGRLFDVPSIVDPSKPPLAEEDLNPIPLVV